MYTIGSVIYCSFIIFTSFHIVKTSKCTPWPLLEPAGSLKWPPDPYLTFVHPQWQFLITALNTIPSYIESARIPQHTNGEYRGNALYAGYRQGRKHDYKKYHFFPDLYGINYFIVFESDHKTGPQYGCSFYTTKQTFDVVWDATLDNYIVHNALLVLQVDL